MVALIGEHVFALEPSASSTLYEQGPGVSVNGTTGCRDAVAKEPRNEVEGVSWPKEVCPATEEPPEPGRRETEAEPTERPAETEEPADLRQPSPWPGALCDVGVAGCEPCGCRPAPAFRRAARFARRSRRALKARRCPSSFARWTGSRTPMDSRSCSSVSRTSIGPSTSSRLKGTPHPGPSSPSTQSATSSGDQTTQSRLRSSPSWSLPALGDGEEKLSGGIEVRTSTGGVA
mmetsp:Transcript_122530/g.357808  ORF Transcript_122530/g.357808 Transcript_122530/m.357808 type:complete len:232 (+) Transcript_122530:461-1156(+)